MCRPPGLGFKVSTGRRAWGAGSGVQGAGRRTHVPLEGAARGFVEADGGGVICEGFGRYGVLSPGHPLDLAVARRLRDLGPFVLLRYGRRRLAMLYVKLY